jgi:beta-fructofuranosidase
MSLPRILHLNGNRELIQTPAPELRVLRGKHITLRDVTLNSETMVVDGAQGDSLEIRAEFQAGTARAFGLRLRRSGDEIIIKRSADQLDVAGTEVPLNPSDDGTFKLHLFLDKSVLEAFIDGGRQAVTRVIAAGEEDLGVEIFAAGGDAKVVSLDVWQMAPIW